MFETAQRQWEAVGEDWTIIDNNILVYPFSTRLAPVYSSTQYSNSQASGENTREYYQGKSGENVEYSEYPECGTHSTLSTKRIGCSE